MKKILLLLLMGISSSSYACDICGCYMGLSPYRNFSSAGLFYRYRSFNGYTGQNQTPNAFPTTAFRTTHGDTGHSTGQEETYSQKDYEIYRAYELRLKYFLHPRLEVNALVPYAMNSYKLNGKRVPMHGLGDVTLFGGYHLISNQDDPVTKQRLILGTGTKLGTGRFQLADSLNIRRDALLQPGTGTVDLLLFTNYFFMHRELGVSANFMYKMNSKNLYQERIGNSITSYVNLFYIFKAGDFQIIPLAQLYHEYTRGMIKKGELINGTRMNEVMLGPGLDLYWKGFLLNTAFQWNVYSEVQNGDLADAGRMVMGLSYTILQKKHLLKK